MVKTSIDAQNKELNDKEIAIVGDEAMNAEFAKLTPDQRKEKLIVMVSQA
jgi:hypothetical protein